jgi:hypothetical protein
VSFSIYSSFQSHFACQDVTKFLLLKNQIQLTMRKLLFSPLLFMAVNAFGQAAPTPPPPQPGPPQMEFIVPVQMGTDTLKNGKVTVAISPQTMDEMKQAQASPDYVVMLTPKGDCGALSLGETTDKGFVVKEQKGSGSSSGIFEYVMYVKQRRPARPSRPMMPPGMPQPQQGGQQPPTPVPAPPVQPQQQ